MTVFCRRSFERFLHEICKMNRMDSVEMSIKIANGIDSGGENLVLNGQDKTLKKDDNGFSAVGSRNDAGIESLRSEMNEGTVNPQKTNTGYPYAEQQGIKTDKEERAKRCLEKMKRIGKSRKAAEVYCNAVVK